MKIAINGFGRIGRNILRSYLAKDQVWKKFNQIEIVAINDLGSPKDSAHLLKYDSVHGRLSNQIGHTEDSIQIDGQKIACFSENIGSRFRRLSVQSRKPKRRAFRTLALRCGLRKMVSCRALHGDDGNVWHL